jgi:hypothetical protein
VISRQTVTPSEGDTEGKEIDPEIEERLQGVLGAGELLDGTVRAEMESLFCDNFSDVRIHADKEANEFNQTLGARAFAVGHDIFFRQGEYSPRSQGGRELLAHELTHVVQQSEGLHRKLILGRILDPLEREAEHAEKMVATRESTHLRHSVAVNISRHPIVSRKKANIESQEDLASAIAWLISDILQNRIFRVERAGLYPQYFESLDDLHSANSGERNRSPIPTAKRLELLESALSRLRPVFITLEKEENQKAWMAEHITP